MELTIDKLAAQLNELDKVCASCTCSHEVASLSNDLNDMKRDIRQQASESVRDVESLRESVVHAEETSWYMDEKIIQVLQEKDLAAFADPER